MVKINFDGAIFKDSREAGIGVIVCDSQGLVLASMSKRILLPHSVVHVEVVTIVRDVSFAQELILSSVILKADSKIIIKALCSKDESFSSYGLLIVEDKLYTDTFYSLHFSHIHRQDSNIQL